MTPTPSFLIPESVHLELKGLAEAPFQQEDLRMLAGIVCRDADSGEDIVITTHAFISAGRNRHFGHVNTHSPEARTQLQLMMNFLHQSGRLLGLPVYPFGCAHSHPSGSLYFTRDDLQTFATHARNYGADWLLTPLVFPAGQDVEVKYHLFSPATGQCRPYDEQVEVIPDQELYERLDFWPRLKAFMQLDPQSLLQEIEAGSIKPGLIQQAPIKRSTASCRLPLWPPQAEKEAGSRLHKLAQGGMPPPIHAEAFATSESPPRAAAARRPKSPARIAGWSRIATLPVPGGFERLTVALLLLQSLIQGVGLLYLIRNLIIREIL